MNKLFSFVALCGTLCLYTSCEKKTTPEKVDYTQYVNPFIGGSENGHTFPGACRPFGMVQTSPVTGAVGWRYCSQYHYADSLIWGFTQTNLNGTGCTDLGDILLMPSTGMAQRPWTAFRSRFRKTTETATPGYYTVELEQSDVKVELTAAAHTAFHRYTYRQKADSALLLIDLQHGPAWNDRQYHSHVTLCEADWEDDTTLTGHIQNTVWVKQDCFFVMKFSRRVTSSVQLPPVLYTEKGKRIVASVPMSDGDELLVKVALSTVSVDGARRNLEEEIPGWDFDAVRQHAHNEWNEYLGRVDVDGTNDEKTNFYTSLYHAMIQPNEISDVDGRYRNAADSVTQATGGKFYSTFSLWDTYRAAHPLYTLVTPEKVDGFVNSLVAQGEVQGFLPIWGLWGKETFCMIGNHAVPVIAEAYRKGFRGFDAERAYNMVRQTQTVSHPQKSNWEVYERFGYFPTDLTPAESVSSTLESVYDDYAAADMARRLGKTEDAERFARRAGFYRNLFDAETRFMRPRKADGTWKSPFDPSSVAHAESVGGDYTEGNAWQYTWHVQHDVPGLIRLFGGEKNFLTKLDSVFTVKLETTQSDVTGLIGQYAHGNEPSHHVVYLYTLAGRPERTQELVRQIFDTQYRNAPDGLCGNDDCGQMSAWYIFSAMGFYPVDPVSCEYVLGAPQLPRIALHLPDGKTFTVIAENLSKENKYVQSVTLNGQPYTKSVISHEDILRGGELVFQMRK